MYSAGEGGHKEIIELMLLKGANNWNWGLDAACMIGDKDLAESMIKNGADNLDIALYDACEKGNLNIVEMLIEKGVDDFDLGLAGACQSHNKELIKLMLSKGNLCLDSLEFVDYDIYNLYLKIGGQFHENIYILHIMRKNYKIK
jgi:ankyrin repeat protein